MSVTVASTRTSKPTTGDWGNLVRIRGYVAHVPEYGVKFEGGKAHELEDVRGQQPCDAQRVKGAWVPIHHARIRLCVLQEREAQDGNGIVDGIRWRII